MRPISYGVYKLSTEDKFRFLCRQEIGDISLYEMSGSFEEILKYIEAEKEHYQQYVTEGKEIEDSYLDGRKNKLIKFLEVKVDYVSLGLIVYGLRELDEAEKEAKAKQDEARLEKAKEEKRAQYEKLKKEFETS